MIKIIWVRIRPGALHIYFSIYSEGPPLGRSSQFGRFEVFSLLPHAQGEKNRLKRDGIE